MKKYIWITRLPRRLALVAGAALLLSSLGTNVQAASPTPKPSRAAHPASKQAPPRGKLKTTPLPANAPKPGVRPKAAASRLKRRAQAPATAASAVLAFSPCSPSCDLWALTGTTALAGGPAGGGRHLASDCRPNAGDARPARCRTPATAA